MKLNFIYLGLLILISSFNQEVNASIECMPEISGDTEICLGQSFTLIAAAVLPLDTFVWTVVGPSVPNCGPNNQQSFTCTPTVAGVYTVTVVAGSDFCSPPQTAITTVTVRSCAQPSCSIIGRRNALFDAIRNKFGQ